MRFSFYTRDIDRRTEWRVRENLFDALWEDEDTRVILFNKGKFLVKGNELARIKVSEVTSAQFRVFLGEDLRNGNKLIVQEVSDAAALEAQEYGTFRFLREIAEQLSGVDQHLAFETLAITFWHKNHMYCPKCGAVLMVTHAGWAKECLADASEHFPRIDPAVIILILNDNDELLLANNMKWPKDKYSFIAGYVDPGEPIELAVTREAKEEVNVDLTDLEYLGNQPWPFPSSLMFAYKAKGTGEIKVDDIEIRHARWFKRDELKEMIASKQIDPPGPLSVAYHMMTAWLAEEI
ncbi:MAG: NAD(+) diphosphatase [Micrococcaceae bacterium]